MKDDESSHGHFRVFPWSESEENSVWLRRVRLVTMTSQQDLRQPTWQKTNRPRSHLWLWCFWEGFCPPRFKRKALGVVAQDWPR